MKTVEDKINTLWWVLRIGLGSGLFVSGLDKFFDFLTNWSMYISPAAERLLPVSDTVFMRAVGVLEMALGLGMLAGPTQLASYLAVAWLIGIAGNLLVGSFYDLAVRDLEIALAAFALGRVTEIRKGRPTASK
jgi:uncharacterized membrane protein YphA (DoxX/SURF4 family)